MLPLLILFNKFIAYNILLICVIYSASMDSNFEFASAFDVKENMCPTKLINKS